MISSEGTPEAVLAGTARYAILHGPMRELLTGLPENSIDAAVIDPPYGLGKEPDPVKLLTAWLAGEEYTPGHRGFMAKKWDKFVPSPSDWRAVYRVLKPGAHIAVFAGTRTADLMGISLRLAGFEKRDYVEWIQAQGYRKSVPLGEGIGTGLKPAHEPVLLFRKPLEGTLADNYAKWGTGSLQIDLCRVTYASKQDFEVVAERVAKLKEEGGSLGGSWKNDSDLSGANDPSPDGRWPPNLALGHLPGCIEIGESQVSANPTWDTPERATRPSWFTGPEVSKVRHTSPTPDASHHELNPDHKPGCKFTGEHRAMWRGEPSELRLELALSDLKYWQCEEGCTAKDRQKETIERFARGREGEPSAERRYDDRGSTSFAMKPGARRDDEETVVVWACEPGCPVREIGEQTGILRSGSMQAGTVRSRRHGAVYGEMSGIATDHDIDGDVGTGAKYYPQFQALPAELDQTFLYCPKAPRSEKERGLEEFREVEGGKATGRKEGSKGVRNPRAGAGRTGGVRNTHPTVKPTRFIRWLMRLVTPPNGVCLDTHAGTGTSGEAALYERLRWIGIELNDTDEDPYVSFMRARLAAAEGQRYMPRESLRAKPLARAPRHPLDL